MTGNASFPFILASASPRRSSLLQQHGLAFTVLPAGVEEISPPHLSPGEIALRNARAKAEAVAHTYRSALVLGVDTLVEYAGQVYGKPRDLAEARAMLGRLNGQTHAVYSGVWLTRREPGKTCGFIEITQVRFHRRTLAEMESYLARIGPLDKAGAYAAQDDRGEMIQSVEGSFSNVIGLPMERLLPVLEQFHSTAA